MNEEDAFRPALWLPGPHLQTILPAVLPGPRPSLRDETLTVRVAREASVRLDIDRPSGASRATLLLLHGMCGSSESSHVLRTAMIARMRGWTTVRMNLRTCGGTESLSDSLYNAGQSSDLERVLRQLDSSFPRPFFVVGFSLGGNIALRYAALAGAACGADAVAAINPPVDLACCARTIERPGNWIYREYYVRRLCAQLERFLRLRRPGAPAPRRRSVRTIRRFDELYTAPDAGYRSAEEYYAEASAGPRLSGIRRPTLVLSALDDPFVPATMFEPYHGSPRLTFEHPSAGGHCGYWQGALPRYWAGVRVADFFEAVRV